MADNTTNSTTGHEDEVVTVEGLKAALQKLKDDLVDPKVANVAFNSTSGKIQQTNGDGTTSDVVTPDTTPTENSVKPVTSGGVFTAIQELIINPISDNDISASSTFKKRDAVSVDGTMYIASKDTNQLPFKTAIFYNGALMLYKGNPVFYNKQLSGDWIAK